MAYAASDIHFLRLGQGPPLMMVHGNPATHSLWRPISGPLAQERTVYMVDLPGFGRSPAPSSHAGFALERIAHVLLDFADHHGLDRFDLVGHSFGGAISATIASLHPERIRSLALITPLGIETPPLGRLAGIKPLHTVAGYLWRQAPHLLKGGISRAFCRMSYGPAYTPERAREVAHEAAERIDLPRSSGALMTSADLTAYAAALAMLNDRCRMPLLLVGCGADRIVPFRQFERVREKLPRAIQKTFHDGCHVPIWQYPEELVMLLQEFLSMAEVPNV